MAISKEAIGKRIRDRREQFSLTREALCALLKGGGFDISNTQLFNIESGKNSITADNLVVVANALKTPVVYFYGMDAQPPLRPEEYTALSFMGRMSTGEISGWLLPLMRLIVEIGEIKARKAN